ncbi:transposase DNA-binding-containing protein [Burkholderia sp. BCC1981]|uniref:transposase DNA-binding-containing protein n=1 Tax=Burkholderia sp. BCC1981 TaxID=2817441 RepID=UPI0039F1D9B5
MVIEDDTARLVERGVRAGELGDARLSQRLVALACQLAASPYTSLPKPCRPPN